MALVYHHGQIVTAPVPLDLYEGTAPLITGIIADGENPFTRPFQPRAAYVYPPLYNMLVAPLTQVFGNTFALHRSVSAVFIMLAAGLCGLAARRDCRSWIFGATAAVLLYAALLFYATPVSSTNAPGVALFLAGLLVPWFRRFSNGSLAFALVCGLLAFYTKQYFILGTAILCLYLFLYVSMSRALLLGAVFALALLTSLAVVHASSPYYLDNNLFAPAAAIRGLQTWSILGMQLQFYVWVYAGLLGAMAISGVYTAMGSLRSFPAGGWSGYFTPVRAGWRKPLLAKPAGFFGFCLFWATLAIVASLGRNPGNWMTYLFQLMSPFLLLAGLGAIARSPAPRWLIAPLLMFNCYTAWDILHKDFSVDLDNWREVEQMIAGSDEVLATQMLVMALLEQGKAVHQDGHTFYFPLAVSKPAWLVKERPEDRVEAVWQEYIAQLYRGVERREFDLVLVSPWEMRGIFERNPPPFEAVGGREFLARHYWLDRKIRLSMTDRHGGGTWDVQVWRPKGAGGGE
jgi:4-amino-4-deoxy-L-arabinose transferase-like glycosyltransferase